MVIKVPSRSNSTASGGPASLRRVRPEERTAHSPFRRWNTATGGIAALLSTMAAISSGVLGPGQIRRRANSAVTAPQTRPARAASRGRPPMSAAAAVRAAPTVSRCRPIRPGVVPICCRQLRPNFARIKALSALPA